MTWQTATALFITGLIVAAIVYDLLAYSLGGSEATISSLCLNTANRNRGFAMAFAFCFGLLCGHIFFASEGRADAEAEVAEPFRASPPTRGSASVPINRAG